VLLEAWRTSRTGLERSGTVLAPHFLKILHLQRLVDYIVLQGCPFRKLRGDIVDTVLCIVGFATLQVQSITR
jgi:hypothetical protein